jgi:hypothetical protein
MLAADTLASYGRVLSHAKYMKLLRRTDDELGLRGLHGRKRSDELGRSSDATAISSDSSSPSERPSFVRAGAVRLGALHAWESTVRGSTPGFVYWGGVLGGGGYF